MQLRKWAAVATGLAIAATASMAATAADIEMTFRFNDPEAEEMRAALDAFEQENPGVEVELQTIAWGESRQQFLREAAVGEGPDVVHIAFRLAARHGCGGGAPAAQRSPGDAVDPGGLRRLHRDRALGRSGRQTSMACRGLRTPGQWSIAPTCWKPPASARSPVPGRRCAMRAGRSTRRPARWGSAFPAGAAPSNTIWFLANYYWWSNGSALVAGRRGRLQDGNHR